METPNYFAIIPANVRYDKNLKANEKLLYGEITSLTHSTGKCFASNDYFAKLYDTSKETVSRWISDLAKLGYIKIEIVYKENSKQIINRYIQINQEGIDEKINSPIDEKVKDNKTRVNNKINMGKNSFITPTLEEIKLYVEEKSIDVDYKYFYEYFTEGNWRDAKGNQVISWKQKLLTWSRNNKPKDTKVDTKEKTKKRSAYEYY